ncbi:hypothetical protein OF83DRAFT_1170087 [Amylostereum chailletii]|nr:hypothetical protein OF83DRAFT_1170087 [Amylostereum chailletii]
MPSRHPRCLAVPAVSPTPSRHHRPLITTVLSPPLPSHHHCPLAHVVSPLASPALSHPRRLAARINSPPAPSRHHRRLTTHTILPPVLPRFHCPHRLATHTASLPPSSRRPRFLATRASSPPALPRCPRFLAAPAVSPPPPPRPRPLAAPVISPHAPSRHHRCLAAYEYSTLTSPDTKRPVHWAHNSPEESRQDWYFQGSDGRYLTDEDLDLATDILSAFYDPPPSSSPPPCQSTVLFLPKGFKFDNVTKKWYTYRRNQRGTPGHTVVEWQPSRTNPVQDLWFWKHNQELVTPLEFQVACEVQIELDEAEEHHKEL